MRVPSSLAVVISHCGNWRGRVKGYSSYIPGSWIVNHLEVSNFVTNASAWRSYRRLRPLIESSAFKLSSTDTGIQHAAVDG